jgi:indolepyruvate ferredoxin oxidoreductase alpha subunit
MGKPADRILASEGKLLLLGNEAIARGCLEAGVSVAATYPGTPSSEIGTVLERIADDVGLVFEYSVNEKVAMEVCGAASASGLRSFVFMKHVGLNVASDPFMTLAYAGIRGGMVVLSADDPSCHSSQDEQDNRHFAKLANVPMLEPSTPCEAKDMVLEAFKISERLEVPVLFRTTTRVSHARGLVPLGPILEARPCGRFEKDPRRFVMIPAHARNNRLKLLERSAGALKLSETSRLNFISGNGKIGVITSGVSYTYVKEFLRDVEILKLGFTNPVPEEKMKGFIEGKEKVIVVEELDPYLEDEALRIAKSGGIDVPILGKRTGHLPQAFEFSPDTMLNLRGVLQVVETKDPLTPKDLGLPGRPPVLCAGCPHRATYYATRIALGKEEAVFSSDVGCYSLGIQPPLETADFLLCMGSSVGAAGGFTSATNQKVVGFIGDSTFFHAGIPGLINAVFNDHRYLLIILDNSTTAMTGHQPNPGTGRDFGGKSTEGIDLEKLVRGCGVGYVRTVDPYNIGETIQVMKEALHNDGLAVVIARRACPLLLRKEGVLRPVPYDVDQSRCIHCYTCVRKLSCPALFRLGDEVHIDAMLCIGCGCCSQVCSKHAIGVVD